MEDCYEALIKSEIGEAYFLSFDARIILREGLENKEIDVALDKDNNIQRPEGCMKALAIRM